MLMAHFQSLEGSLETFASIQEMEKTLLKNKVDGNFKQTRITDAFNIKQIILE